MSGSLKRIVAPLRHLRRYNDPFWRWVDRLEKARVWYTTMNLYGVQEHKNLHSIISLSKKVTVPARVNISEEFHAQFAEWTEELERIHLTPDTLKLHNIDNMNLLESRLYHLKTMSSRTGKFSSFDIEESFKLNEDKLKETDGSNIDKESTDGLISMRKKASNKRNSIIIEKKYSADSVAGILAAPTRAPPPPTAVNLIEVPATFSRMHSSECESIYKIRELGSFNFENDLVFSSPLTQTETDLQFPYRGDPFEVTMSASKELVMAKLSLYPEAWLLKHFYVSIWEMFNFGEETIGNFIIAPNFLKDEDEFPSLDLFVWSGEPDAPTFYAFPIVRNQNGFSVIESENSFSSLASLVAHYSFNLTEDLPVLLKHPYLTTLVPTFSPPPNLTLQETYLIHVLECTTENWLTQSEVNLETFKNASLGAFKVQENLNKGLAKLFVNISKGDEKELRLYEINAYDDGLGLSHSEMRFPTLASLISYYCCWDVDIPCQLKYTHSSLTESETTHRMLDISNMAEEVYIARALTLTPQSWYCQEANPDDVTLRTKLLDQPIGNFIVTEFGSVYTLLVRSSTDKECPIISFQIEKNGSNFTIQGLSNLFPSIPLLMGYLCCNPSGLLAFLLSIPRVASDSHSKIIRSKSSFCTSEEFRRSSVGRRSNWLSKKHKECSTSFRPDDKLQHFVSALTRNPNTWRFSEISRAMKQVKQLEYRSFVVTPSSSFREHMLLVRTKEFDPAVIELFTIYQSETGTCGFKEENLAYFGLEMLLAHSCCIKVDELPFILNFPLN